MQIALGNSVEILVDIYTPAFNSSFVVEKGTGKSVYIGLMTEVRLMISRSVMSRRHYCLFYYKRKALVRKGIGNAQPDVCGIASTVFQCWNVE